MRNELKTTSVRISEAIRSLLADEVERLSQMLAPRTGMPINVIVKVALSGLFNHRTEIVDGICFGRDTVANGGCHVDAVYRILRDLENDFHIGSLSLSPNRTHI